MSCTCVKELETLIKSDYSGDYRKPIETVTCGGKLLSIGSNEAKIRICTVFDVKLKGQKKLDAFRVANSFCQFCGEKL